MKCSPHLNLLKLYHNIKYKIASGRKCNERLHHQIGKIHLANHSLISHY